MNAEELIDRIYDNLFGLTGMDEIHPPFPTEDITYQWVERKKKYLFFIIDHKGYRVTIEEDNKNVPELEAE